MAIRVEEPVYINCEADTFLEVVERVEAYPEFLTPVRHVNLLRRMPQETIASMDAHLMRDWHYLIAIQANHPRELSWRLIEGPFRRVEGWWRIVDVHAMVLQTRFIAEVDLGVFVPNRLIRMVLQAALPDLLAQYAHRMEAIEKRKREGICERIS